MSTLRTSLLAVLLACAACAGPDATVNPGTFNRTEFDSVNTVLVLRCGSLDCHGDPYRNYRLYGYGGSRLDPRDRPDTDGSRPDEVDANYDATLSLEPEVMARVADGETEAIGELTMVRKARGSEAHEGGAPLQPDGPGERCLVSWLAGRVDEAACAADRQSP